MNVLAICGSLRAQSLNAAVLRAAVQTAPPHWHVTVEPALSRLPYFNADVEQAALPPEVADFRAHAAAADGLIIAGPEYVHGMSGVLKNALEWLVGGGELTLKPVALITVSPAMTGGSRAQAWTRETLQVMGAHVLEDGLRVPGAVPKIVDGRLTDAATSARLGKLLDQLDAAMAAPMISE